MKAIRPWLSALLLALAASAALLPAAHAEGLAEAVVAAADRSPEDRAMDAGRKPVELLSFLGVKPGWRVAEVGAGAGYTAELLRRAVGDTGKLYAQNTPAIVERFVGKPWAARLAKPAMQGVVRLDREMESPLPEDVRDLDAVVMVLVYHDTVWLKVDRAAMNRAIFAALKPGGLFLVVDHSARKGDGATVTDTFHRIEEDVVKADLEAVGFKLDASADFLRNPDDTRDWNDSPRAAGERRGTSDRFVLRFRKP